MPITDLSLITVTGTYLNLDGSPASGTIEFVASTVLVNTVANQIVFPTSFFAPLSSSGTFSITLPATDDPDLSPQGWTYAVTERISGSRSRSYNISIPYNTSGGAVDMADLVPVDASTGLFVLDGGSVDRSGIFVIDGGSA